MPIMCAKATFMIKSSHNRTITKQTTTIFAALSVPVAVAAYP